MESNPALEQHPLILEVAALIDPVVEALGFGPESTYVEYCWLPILGPTSTFAYRRLGRMVVDQPIDGKVRIDLVDLASSLGLGEGIGRNSLMARTLRRLDQFGVAAWRDDTLAVRRALAPLTVRQVARLGWTARAMHERITKHRPMARP